MLAVKNTPENSGYITEQAYLEGEKTAEFRHEYVDGQIYAMAGTSRRHNRIALNIVRHLPLQRQDGTPCDVYSSDVKVRASKRKSFYYPDVVLTCTPDNADAYYVEQPCLIVEVTSKSTDWKDRSEKLLAYQALESLQAYLIVAQDKPHVTFYYRQADDGTWWVAAFEDLDQEITLPCLDTPLALADIYAGVDFTQPAEPDR
ncbi:Uma2 family endonuclease [Thiothrix fructosivorans]|uniref:Uma2 family endonuclease n=1 Tax=Thiothrix fructosivorans TaxID=111770 RepID=A0A8B0SCI5_9GAMM|nr:Uma2 family endonuclease [Thiothrix fructosivorans]MBO0614861.1 Uma2 family endonuclease [Thiothrix fructosivorans]QTX09673.1 Uma2 family endonuclease [Thiothrix fructosivorans]